MDGVARMAGIDVAGFADGERVIVIDTLFGMGFGPRQADAAIVLGSLLGTLEPPPENWLMAFHALAGTGAAWSSEAGQ